VGILGHQFMKKIVFCILLAFSASIGHAASVVASAIENGLGSADGADLAQGNLVRVGVFNISDDVINANSGDLAFLNSNFQEFGIARIGQNIPGNANGLFQSSLLDRPNSDAEGFGNKQLYLWVFNSTDNSTPATSFATAFQHGIFYREFTSPADANNVSGNQWRVRLNGEVPNDVNIDLSDLTNNTNDQLSPGAHVVVGSFPGGANGTTTFKNFNLAIPEPASMALMLIGATVTLVRRRTRK
jgi:hypothetical protein